MTVGFSHNSKHYLAHIDATCRTEPCRPWVLVKIIGRQGQSVTHGDVLSKFWDMEPEWTRQFAEHHEWMSRNVEMA